MRARSFVLAALALAQAGCAAGFRLGRETKPVTACCPSPPVIEASAATPAFLPR